MLDREKATEVTIWIILAIVIISALTACAPLADAMFGSAETAGTVSSATSSPVAGVVDVGLGAVETAAYAIPGIGIFLGGGIALLRRSIRKRAAALALGSSQSDENTKRGSTIVYVSYNGLGTAEVSKKVETQE